MRKGVYRMDYDIPYARLWNADTTRSKLVYYAGAQTFRKMYDAGVLC